MRAQLHHVLSASDAQRRENSVSLEELQALGTIIVLEGAGAAYPLKVDSLNRLSAHRTSPKRPMWLLLSVQPATDDEPERATVWVSDAYRQRFLQLFQDYLERLSTAGNPANWTTPEGNPANQALIANISRIRDAVLADLWTSAGEPPSHGMHWWELWLDTSQPALDVFDAFVAAQQLRTVPRAVSFRDRHVVWVHASWSQLQILLFSRVPIAEIRRPEFLDTVDDLHPHEQDEYVQDLADRVLAADTQTSPAVCHLDTGVFQGHALLRGSLDPGDVHSIIGTSGHDVHGHGTAMAGLALLGDLDPLLTGTQKVQLEHRLESVRMTPAQGEALLDPIDYGTATADAVALPEITAARRRVFCMPLSANPDKPGEPTLWSATVDALATGTDIVRDGRQLRLLSPPDPSAARLIIIAAGNVDSYQLDHRAESDTSAIQDPSNS
ncbi:S8 family serine peptidase [Cellulomonas hominis]|nr:S8 family serine peptidase [Cellulomonas hominis]